MDASTSYYGRSEGSVEGQDDADPGPAVYRKHGGPAPEQEHDPHYAFVCMAADSWRSHHRRVGFSQRTPCTDRGGGPQRSIMLVLDILDCLSCEARMSWMAPLRESYVYDVLEMIDKYGMDPRLAHWITDPGMHVRALPYGDGGKT